jgi:hypothetical protein
MSKLAEIWKIYYMGMRTNAEENAAAKGKANAIAEVT